MTSSLFSKRKFLLCVYIRLNSSKTIGGTNMKRHTIDHHPAVSIIRHLMMPQDKLSKISAFDRGKPF